MRIGVLGVGAVGGWFGGRLALAGYDVVFLARGETLTRLREVGLTLIDEHGEQSIIPVKAADNWDELTADGIDVDVVIAATKALPGNDPFPQVPAGAAVVTTHNSVEIPYLAAGRFGEDKVFPGVIRGFFIHTGPAEVTFRPGPMSLNIGTFDGSTNDLVGDVIEALHTAGLGGEQLPDIWVDIWAKAMFVANLGALGALADSPIGYLRSEMRDSLTRMFKETEAVGRACGVVLPEDIVSRTLAFTDAQGYDNTSSMQRDYTAGLTNELDAQIGAIRRMGQKVSVETPTLDLVYDALVGRQQKHKN